MHRRDVLAALAGSASVAGAAGLVGGASSTPRSDAQPPSHPEHSSPARPAARTGAQDAYEPLGTVDLEGTRELAVSDDGTVGYVAVNDGVATVDLSDPTAPEVLAERRGLFEDVTGGPLRLVWDCWPDGDRLLAAGPAQRVAGESVDGAVLFDVSDPADPQLLARHRTEFSIHNCFFADGHAYLTGNGLPGNPLVILDATDGQFVEVGRWALTDHEPAWGEVSTALRQLHDVFVQDGIAYLPYWDAGTYLVDVSDPANPSYLGHTGRYEPDQFRGIGLGDAAAFATGRPGNSHYVEVDPTGDLMAVGRESWTVPRGNCTSGGPGGVDLYDVGDPADVTHLSTVDPPKTTDDTRNGEFTTAHNLDLVDGRLYTSWYFGGVKLHDVSDPSAPEELAWWRQPGEAVFWTAQAGVPGEYYVASSADDAAGFDDGITGRIYVFPDRAGGQSDPPSLLGEGLGGSSSMRCSWIGADTGP